MVRRRKLPPDNRPKWDDPLNEVYIGGSYMPVTFVEELAKAQYLPNGRPTNFNPIEMPLWRNDPSYNWARKRTSL